MVASEILARPFSQPDRWFMSLPKTLPFRRPLGIALPLPQEPEPMLAKQFDAAVNLSLPSRIAIIGNYLPRQCGIATFTTDLCDAVSTEFGTERLFALPVNDPESEYSYPERVRFELTEEELASYNRGPISSISPMSI